MSPYPRDPFLGALLRELSDWLQRPAGVNDDLMLRLAEIEQGRDNDGLYTDLRVIWACRWSMRFFNKRRMFFTSKSPHASCYPFDEAELVDVLRQLEQLREDVFLEHTEFKILRCDPLLLGPSGLTSSQRSHLIRMVDALKPVLKTTILHFTESPCAGNAGAWWFANLRATHHGRDEIVRALDDLPGATP